MTEYWIPYIRGFYVPRYWDGKRYVPLGPLGGVSRIVRYMSRDAAIKATERHRAKVHKGNPDAIR